MTDMSLMGIIGPVDDDAAVGMRVDLLMTLRRVTQTALS